MRGYTRQVSSDESSDRSALLAADEEDTRVALRRLLNVAGASIERRAHLERALESRIVIEQAKGILAERLRLSLEDAFNLLRRASRSNQRRIHELAREVVEQAETPKEILGSLQEVLSELRSGTVKR
jgi:hypothetical protein